MMRGVLVLIAALWACAPAWATPPRVTTSEDRILAATQTHFYVLRDVMDNQGSHYSALHDQHLVEINLQSGEATQYWPLRRMAVSHLETDDFLLPGLVTERDGPTHDLNTILREKGAEPVISSPWAVTEISLENGALMRGDKPLATPFAIRAAARAQLGILRDEYPPIETEAEYIRAETIDFYDLYAPGEWLCEMRPEGQSLTSARERVTMVKLQCEDEEFSGTWSFHMLVRDEL